jgi:hypothetical protein
MIGFEAEEVIKQSAGEGFVFGGLELPRSCNGGLLRTTTPGRRASQSLQSNRVKEKSVSRTWHGIKTVSHSNLLLSIAKTFNPTTSATRAHHADAALQLHLEL